MDMKLKLGNGYKGEDANPALPYSQSLSVYSSSDISPSQFGLKADILVFSDFSDISSNFGFLPYLMARISLAILVFDPTQF